MMTVITCCPITSPLKDFYPQSQRCETAFPLSQRETNLRTFKQSVD